MGKPRGGRGFMYYNILKKYKIGYDLYNYGIIYRLILLDVS